MFKVCACPLSVSVHSALAECVDAGGHMQRHRHHNPRLHPRLHPLPTQTSKVKPFLLLLSVLTHWIMSAALITITNH